MIDSIYWHLNDVPDAALTILLHWLTEISWGSIYWYPILQIKEQKLLSLYNLCSVTESMRPEPRIKPKL